MGKINDEQRQILDSLIIERIKDSKDTSVVNCFSNKSNTNLVNVLKKQALGLDCSGSIAYYLVKTKNGELLFYFSLKSGILFDNSIDVGKCKEKYISLKAKKLNMAPQKKNFLKFLFHDCKKEKNTNIHRVINTYPAIELVEFCRNENAIEIWKSMNVGRKLGECVFWHFIVPKVLNTQEIVGCQYLYLFAADASDDANLINYYKVCLKFEESVGLAANKPAYDLMCTLLYQDIKKLKQEKEEFYSNFNINKDDSEYV